MNRNVPVMHELLLPLVAVATAILVLAVAVYLLKSWLRDNEDNADSCHELLGQYREMALQGELTDEEYRLIKGRLVSRIGQTPQPAEKSVPPSEEEGAR